MFKKEENIKLTKTKFKDLLIIESEPHSDERGLFFRTFCKNEFASFGLNKEFVQINQSINYTKGTFRGFHYQKPPYTDEKLIRCISGRVLDIVIDIRKKSKTYMNFFSIELTSENKKMLYIPDGFAHGFITLEDNSQLIYQHTEYYVPNHEASINYKDPAINLKLPIAIKVISEKDLNVSFIDTDFKGL